ncbi:MAG: hypothetical protein ED557_02355 [Balneola sp.]|nr:MAG: hypothetical protein ED557_02355 [Balneola sp.]
MPNKIIALPIFLLFFGNILFAQEKVTLTKISTPIILDGVADEPAWESVPYLNPVQYEPVYKGKMNEVTRFKVAYDENYVYVMGELYTKDPGTIVTNSLVRDQYSSDDVFAIIIDGFNDNQNATWFFINPDGVRFDFAVSNDADFSGGRNAINSSWNTFWDAETSKSEEGWFAEIRVPFSSIGVQVDASGETEMGIIVYRWLAAINERHIYPAIPPNWNLGNAKPSQAQDVRLNGVNSKNPVYFTPYGLTGVARQNELSVDSSAYGYEDDLTRELGFDLKYNLTSNLTADLTVNTDFAQVEADDQQLNLSRFSLFFPEKRQFFQQRAGLFDFSFGRDRVFYSRRIGLDDDGNPVRILGGGRVTGRVGNLDVGVINLQTAKTSSLASENFGVVRLKQQVLNERSFVGGIATTRVNTDGHTNFVFGLDTELDLGKETFFEARGAFSSDDEDSVSFQDKPQDLSTYRLSVRRSTNTGINYQATFTRIGDNYDPELGFVRLGGISQKFARLGYGWFASEESIVQRHSFRFAYFGRFFNDDHSLLDFENGLESRFTSFRWSTNFKLIGSFDIEVSSDKEVIPVGDDFDVLDRITIPANSYSTNALELSYEFSEAWKIAGGVDAVFGTFYDGTLQEFSINPRFFASRKLEIGGSYRLTHLDFPSSVEQNTSTGDVTINRSITEFTSHLGQFRAQYAFNKKATLSTFVQYSNVEELAGANLRFRYNFSEGRDFWIVLNETVNTEQRQMGLPNLPFVENGSILIKYNHTFAF